MKKLWIVLGLSLGCFSSPLLAKKSSTLESKYVDGVTFITNNSKKKVKVQWGLSLSETLRSPVYNQVIGPKVKNFQTKEVAQWFESESKQFVNAPVYTLEVKVFDVNNDSVLSEEEIKITRHHKELVKDNPMNNLHIVINSNYSIDYFLK